MWWLKAFPPDVNQGEGLGHCEIVLRGNGCHGVHDGLVGKAAIDFGHVTSEEEIGGRGSAGVIVNPEEKIGEGRGGEEKRGGEGRGGEEERGEKGRRGEEEGEEGEEGKEEEG